MFRRRQQHSFRGRGGVGRDTVSASVTDLVGETPLINNEFVTPTINSSTSRQKYEKAASVEDVSDGSVPVLEDLSLSERKGSFILVFWLLYVLLERLLIEDALVMDKLEQLQNDLDGLTINAKNRAETAKTVG